MSEESGKNESTLSVPYIVHEGIVARGERIIRRLIAALVVCIILIFASNALWLYAWMQYDYVSEDVTVDSNDGGNANYIGNDGDIINNGEGESPETKPY